MSNFMKNRLMKTVFLFCFKGHDKERGEGLYLPLWGTPELPGECFQHTSLHIHLAPPVIVFSQ